MLVNKELLENMEMLCNLLHLMLTADQEEFPVSLAERIDLRRKLKATKKSAKKIADFLGVETKATSYKVPPL